MRSKSTSPILWPMVLGVVCVLALAGSVSTAKAESTGADGFVVVMYYDNPHGEWDEDGWTFKEVINSFDFGPDDQLYYTTGIKKTRELEQSWDVGFTLYTLYEGQPEVIFYDPGAFGMSGGRVKSIKDKVYFNDGGTASRRTFDYYRYDPVDDSHVKIHDSDLDHAADLWGLSTWSGTDFWASGGRPARIYYSSLENGDSLSPIDLGQGGVGPLGGIKVAAGPVGLDPDGNLYFAEGGFRDTYIWRFTAAEVFAAMNHPETDPLVPTEEHRWDTICDYEDGTECQDAPRGASSMSLDHELGMFLAATRFIYPSELRWYRINDDGTSGGFIVMARSDGRIAEVRSHNGQVYFSDPDGIYSIDVPGPEVEIASSHYQLWPPNHKMHRVRVVIQATDNFSDPENLELDGVFVSSNEPDNGRCDGNTVGDVNGKDGYDAWVKITDAFEVAYTEDNRRFFSGRVNLRAERAGCGTGRAYTIKASVKDEAGNTTAATSEVTVPRNQ